jgi:chromosome segregation ATPase
MIESILKSIQPLIDFLSLQISTHPWEIFWVSITETIIILIMWKWYKVQDISHLEKSINLITSRMLDIENSMKEFGGAIDKLKEENFELRKDLENQLSLYNQKNQENINRLQSHTKSQVEELKQEIKKLMKNNSSHASEINLLKEKINQLQNGGDTFEDSGSTGGTKKTTSLSRIRENIAGVKDKKPPTNSPGGRKP